MCCALKVQFYLIHISNTLEVLNSSANFFIYFAYHRYFRLLTLLLPVIDDSISGFKILITSGHHEIGFVTETSSY